VPPGDPISTAQLSARLTGPARPSRAAAVEPSRERPSADEDSARPDSGPISFGPGLPPSLREARELFEATFIARVLEQCDGNATRAAQRIGISRASIQNKLRDYQIR
jgi:DNA-binding NtrC family response regulator